MKTFIGIAFTLFFFLSFLHRGGSSHPPEGSDCKDDKAIKLPFNWVQDDNKCCSCIEGKVQCQDAADLTCPDPPANTTGCLVVEICACEWWFCMDENGLLTVDEDSEDAIGDILPVAAFIRQRREVSGDNDKGPQNLQGGRNGDGKERGVRGGKGKRQRGKGNGGKSVEKSLEKGKSGGRKNPGKATDRQRKGLRRKRKMLKGEPQGGRREAGSRKGEGEAKGPRKKRIGTRARSEQRRGGRKGGKKGKGKGKKKEKKKGKKKDKKKKEKGKGKPDKRPNEDEQVASYDTSYYDDGDGDGDEYDDNYEYDGDSYPSYGHGGGGCGHSDDGDYGDYNSYYDDYYDPKEFDADFKNEFGTWMTTSKPGDLSNLAMSDSYYKCHYYCYHYQTILSGNETMLPGNDTTPTSPVVTTAKPPPVK